MKLIFILLINIFYFSHISFGQSNAEVDFSRVDTVMDKLPDSLSGSSSNISNYILGNFTKNDDKIRAVFYWLCNNIEYDVQKVNDKNIIENDEEYIEKTLTNKKGICADYASLFTDLCTRLGIKSYVVEGYTLKYNSLDYTSHAWNTAYIDSAWYLFDPTWAAGYIKNKKFVKQFNNTYYKVKPSDLIKTHMPFNYTFQLDNYPISHKEFIERKRIEITSKAYFNFIDSISIYANESRHDRYISEQNCLIDYLGNNTIILDRLFELKKNIEVDKKNRLVFTYNTSVIDYNDGIKAYNKFIKYRNDLFLPIKSDKEIQRLLTSVKIKFDDAHEKLLSINNSDQNFENLVNKQLTKVVEAQKLVKDQQDWLNLYFSKNPKERRLMFYAR